MFSIFQNILDCTCGTWSKICKLSKLNSWPVSTLCTSKPDVNFLWLKEFDSRNKNWNFVARQKWHKMLIISVIINTWQNQEILVIRLIVIYENVKSVLEKNWIESFNVIQNAYWFSIQFFSYICKCNVL